MTTPNRSEQIEGLRALVDFLEGHPTVPIPELESVIVCDIPELAGFLAGAPTVALPTWDATGPFDSTGYYVWLVRYFGPIALEGMTYTTHLGRPAPTTDVEKLSFAESFGLVSLDTVRAGLAGSLVEAEEPIDGQPSDVEAAAHRTAKDELEARLLADADPESRFVDLGPAEKTAAAAMVNEIARHYAPERISSDVVAAVLVAGAKVLGDRFLLYTYAPEFSLPDDPHRAAEGWYGEHGFSGHLLAGPGPGPELEPDGPPETFTAEPEVVVDDDPISAHDVEELAILLRSREHSDDEVAALGLGTVVEAVGADLDRDLELNENGRRVFARLLELSAIDAAKREAGA